MTELVLTEKAKNADVRSISTAVPGQGLVNIKAEEAAKGISVDNDLAVEALVATGLLEVRSSKPKAADSAPAPAAKPDSKEKN